MAVVWAVANGNWNIGATWNTGSVPTSADDVWANGFTVNMDANATVNSLNNSARARDIATPLMTGYTTPQGTAISSGDNGLSTAWRAFNRNTSSLSDQRWQSTTNNTGWVGFQFNNGLSSKVINQYLIYGSSTLANNPNTWTLEGSNDGVTWIVLHTVIGSTIGANGTYSSPLLANTTSYEYYRINVTAVGTAGNSIIIPEIELYQQYTAALAAGGSFNFNTAGVSVTCTSTSASLSAGATNLIQVTATTGTVTLNLSSNVAGGSAITTILHSGNGNFNLNGQNFTGGGSAFAINKTGGGLLTVTGNLIASSNAAALTISNGNAIVTGNVIGVGGSTAASAISSTSPGTITVTGNINGGTLTNSHGMSLTNAASQFTVIGNVIGGTAASAHGISTSGAGTITGNVLGGRNATAYGVNATGTLVVNGNVTGDTGNGILTTNTLTVTGTVQGGPVAAIASTSANTINVTGDVYASATANGISSTNASGVVNLTGNMYNGLGRNAIYCQNVFISNTATTLWRMDTGGGDYKFLYSADTTPNLPATTNVRNGVTYGPALSLTGTMVVPAASDVRENVPVDNTVGTGELTSADIISGINASSDSLAVRLKNILTDKAAGNIISQYKDA